MLKILLGTLLNTLHIINTKSGNQLIFNGSSLLTQIAQTDGISRYYKHLPVQVLVIQTLFITYDIYIIDLFTLEILLHHSGDELNCKDSVINNPNELIYTVFIDLLNGSEELCSDHEVSNNSFSFTFHLKRKLTTVYKDYGPPIYKSISIEDSFAINYFNQHCPYTYHKFKT